MNNLQELLETLEFPGRVSPERAIEIDKNLSEVNGNEIAGKHMEIVMEYINFRLLHGSVSAPVSEKLHALYESLSARSMNA